MDEKDLLIFLTLADTGNLTRTAEKLYLSQPTTWRQIWGQRFSCAANRVSP